MSFFPTPSLAYFNANSTSEFCLVAGPDELSEASSTSDRHSPSRRGSKISPSPSRRRSISHSSPPSTPTSFEDFSDLSHRPPSLSLAPLTNIKSEHSHTSLYDTPSGLPAVPEMDQPSLMVNRVAGICLWADGMDPNYIDVDALPFASPSSPSSPNASTHIPSGGVVRTSLRVKLTMPLDVASDSLSGFSGALSFVAPVSSSAECMTRVHVDNTCISRETGRLIPVNDLASGASRTPFVAMLPDSWLTRCRWLDTGSKKTIVTQQVVVDSEAIFVVIYDLHRTRASPGPMGTPSLQKPTAELMLWNKHIDTAITAPPALLPLPMGSPSTSRFGDAGNAANAYLYSTAGGIAGSQLPQYMSPVQHHSPHSPAISLAHSHHSNSPGLGHALPPTGHSNTASSGAPGSNETTPTRIGFPMLSTSGGMMQGAPGSVPPNTAHSHSGSSSGSSTIRSCAISTSNSVGGAGGNYTATGPSSLLSFTPSGMGMAAGVGIGGGAGAMGGAMPGLGHSTFGDPWTTPLLPLF